MSRDGEHVNFHNLAALASLFISFFSSTSFIFLEMKYVGCNLISFFIKIMVDWPKGKGLDFFLKIFIPFVFPVVNIFARWFLQCSFFWGKDQWIFILDLLPLVDGEKNFAYDVGCVFLLLFFFCFDWDVLIHFFLCLPTAFPFFFSTESLSCLAPPCLCPKWARERIGWYCFAYSM